MSDAFSERELYLSPPVNGNSIILRRDATGLTSSRDKIVRVLESDFARTSGNVTVLLMRHWPQLELVGLRVVTVSQQIRLSRV